MNSDFGKKLLSIIKEADIKPKPKWIFVFKNLIIWAVFGLSVILGSLATAVTIFVFTHSDYSLMTGGMSKIFLAIPYFWIMLLIIFIFVAYFDFKHTKGGYKYNPFIIVIVSILISVVLGGVVYSAGGGEKLETVFYQRVYPYQKLMHLKSRGLVSPEMGKLVGDVHKVGDTLEQFDFRDFNGHLWIVYQKDNYITVRSGDRIIIFGNKISNNEFEAENIQPFFKGPPRPFERKFQNLRIR